MFKKTESFDDIVFKDRNKSYGAYDLRKRYSKRGSIALAVSLFILFVSVGVPLIAGIINRVDILVITGLQGPATLSNFDDPIATPPPPPHLHLRLMM